MTNEEFKEYMQKYDANKALFKAEGAEQAQMALDAGADVNSQTWCETQLTYAMRCEDIEKALFLIKNGIDVNAKYKDAVNFFEPPLWSAIDLRLPFLAELLIANGADPNAQKEVKDSIPNPVLFKALEKGMYETAKLLIAAGANPYAKVGKFTIFDLYNPEHLKKAGLEKQMEYYNLVKQTKSDPVFQFKLSEIKKRLKSRLRDVFGVVTRSITKNR